MFADQNKVLGPIWFKIVNHVYMRIQYKLQTERIYIYIYLTLNTNHRESIILLWWRLTKVWIETAINRRFILTPANPLKLVLAKSSTTDQIHKKIFKCINPLVTEDFDNKFHAFVHYHIIVSPGSKSLMDSFRNFD